MNWRRGDGDGRIFLGDPYFTGDHKKHVILYPGFKDAPEEEPFGLFHQHLEAMISAASHLLFIGFSFRDDYINSLLKNNTDSAASVVAIGHSKVPLDIPYLEEKVKFIGGGFNQESVKAALRSLGL